MTINNDYTESKQEKKQRTDAKHEAMNNTSDISYGSNREKSNIANNEKKIYILCASLLFSPTVLRSLRHLFCFFH